MKKFTLLFIVQLFLLTMSPISTAAAQDEKFYYAKVLSSAIYLCSTPSETSGVFEIPATYFVKVDYVVDDYFKISYDGIDGYVKKDKVSLMDGTPQNPYANANFKVFVPYSLHQSPSQSSAATASLSTSLSIKYYGTKIGEQVTTTSNLWYYASVTVEGQTVFGYVFSGVADPQPQISPNNESFQIVNEEVLSEPSSEFSSLSAGTKVILIVAIAVPSLLILYFLIKPSKIMQITKTKKQIKKEHKRVQHGDYFEFDESEL